MAEKGKVLLMDDEQIILDVSDEVLKFLGYEVLFAREGQEALDLYQREKAAGRPFDLVILDLTIPEGMDGMATIKALRALDPQVKAVVSSGHSNNPIMMDYGRYGFSGRLTKPYRISDMKNLLESMIKK